MAKLVYDCQMPKDGGDGTVTVRMLQYVIDDHPRFYMVSCFVNAELFDKYLQRFEASARSFERIPIPGEPHWVSE